MSLSRCFRRSFLYPAKSNIITSNSKLPYPANLPVITCNSKLPVHTQLSSVKFLHSRQLFDEKPQRDLFSLNALLASHFRNNDPLATWILFQHLHCNRTDLDSHTFTPVLGACSVLTNSRRGIQVHALMIKAGSDIETVPKTALMDMYSKYGLVDESVRVFDEMGSKDVVTWNAFLSNFLRNGKLRKALDVFGKMMKERVIFTEFTICSLLKVCSSLKAMRQGMQVHALVVTMGRDKVVLATALIDFYSDVGLIDKAMKIYWSLDCRKDNVLRNSFIAACVKNQKYKEAFLLMSRMKPNIVALTSALTACSKKSDLRTAKQIHGVAIRIWLTDDTQLSNALLDMYSKCGKVSLALSVFDGMPHRDVVSWTSMIDAYGSHGKGYEAVALFTKMEEDVSSVMPNDVTLLAVLSACSHSGLVDRGRECFSSIEGKYGLFPNSSHYACFIDILGRAGHINEVWCLYDEMIKKGIKPTAAVWAALLNACGQNNAVSRGEFAAKQLSELEPDKPGIYVLVSNFYAAIGKWDIVDQLRLEMKKKGLFKDAGSSWYTTFGVSEYVTEKSV